MPNQYLPALHQMVSILMASELPTAVRRKSFFVNDVPPECYISTDQQILATVIRGLLHTVVTHTTNSCIRITANCYGPIVLMHVKDSNSFNYNGIYEDLQPVQQIAGKMGGFVSITSKREDVTTITFSFPNQLTA
jgi:hypothetical protein